MMSRKQYVFDGITLEDFAHCQTIGPSQDESSDRYLFTEMYGTTALFFRYDIVSERSAGFPGHRTSPYLALSVVGVGLGFSGGWCGLSESREGVPSREDMLDTLLALVRRGGSTSTEDDVVLGTVFRLKTT